MRTHLSGPRSHRGRLYGGVCDRCSTAFLIGHFPNLALCPGCYIGAMEPIQRGRLIGHVQKTGNRVA